MQTPLALRKDNKEKVVKDYRQSKGRPNSSHPIISV